MANEEPGRGRTVLVALVAMVAVALVLGGVVGAVALGAVRVAGVGGSDDAGPTSPPSLYIPSDRPTRATRPRDDSTATPSKPATPRKPRTQVTLFAGPARVAPGGRINLNGVYAAGEGAQLQVQRLEGATWTDFPVTATVRGGGYETWIQTSRTGLQRFRVLDRATGRSSNVVRVTVG